MPCNIYVYIGLFTAIIGFTMYFLAKRLPVNPFVGFRIGYTYSSKRLWVKYNRLAGLTVGFIGLLMMVLALIINSTIILTIVFLSLITIDTVFLSVMASREAEEILGREAYRVEKALPTVHKPTRIHPVKPGAFKLTLMILPPIFSLLASLFLIEYMPDRIPSHFNIYGLPDSYQSLEEFLYITLPLFISLELIGPLFVFIEKHNPLIFYKPGVPKRVVVNFLYNIGIMFSWLLFLSLIDIEYYSINSRHIITYTLFNVLYIIFVSYALIKGLLIWKRWMKGRSF